jgi:hypothetical protein
VLFAPPQQQSRLFHSSASYLFALYVNSISNTNTHTVFLLCFQQPPQQRLSRSINRFAASQSPTAIATIEYLFAPDNDRHTIECHAVQQQLLTTIAFRAPQSSAATTIIRIEYHTALQCNNQQCLSPRQPSRRRRHGNCQPDTTVATTTIQTTVSMTTVTKNTQPNCCSNNLGVQKPRCLTAMLAAPTTLAFKSHAAYAHRFC